MSTEPMRAHRRMESDSNARARQARRPTRTVRADPDRETRNQSGRGAVRLAKPSGESFTTYISSCLIKFDYQNFNLISGANGTGSSNWNEGGLIKPSPSIVEVHWSATDLTVNFAVEWIQSIDRFVVKVYWVAGATVTISASR